MNWVTDILKEIPLSEIQRARLELEGEKHEFEMTRAKTERDDFKTKFEEASAKVASLQKELETEKGNHALTRKELDEARAMIQKFTEKPAESPKITVRHMGGTIRNPI
jgi:chromosome segregation ATPase